LVPKLRLGTHVPETLFRRPRGGPSSLSRRPPGARHDPAGAAKQSFAVRRSQTEFGNEGSRGRRNSNPNVQKSASAFRASNLTLFRISRFGFRISSIVSAQPASVLAETGARARKTAHYSRAESFPSV